MVMMCVQIADHALQDLLQRLMVVSVSFFTAVVYLTVPEKAVLHSDAKLILAMTSVTLNILMFMSPLSTVKQVLLTKDAGSINFNMTIATFACGSFWGMYGVIIDDVAISGPNFLGIFSSFIQAALYLYFGSKEENVTPSTQKSIENVANELNTTHPATPMLTTVDENDENWNDGPAVGSIDGLPFSSDMNIVITGVRSRSNSLRSNTAEDLAKSPSSEAVRPRTSSGKFQDLVLANGA